MNNRGPEALNQRRQHALDLIRLTLKDVKVVIFQHVQIVREQKVIFKFICRSASDLEKTAHFAFRPSAAAFRDISANRSGGPPKLAGQPEEALLSEIGR